MVEARLGSSDCGSSDCGSSDCGSSDCGPVTEDALLAGRVRLRQPRHGYRVAIDPVLLAAAVPARPGERVLDMGTGVGAAALCLASRVPGCRVVGLELQPALAGLAGANARLNRVAVDIVGGDVLALPFAPGSFDHVLANPPYLAAGQATPSPQADKARANMEGEAGLAAWIAAAGEAVKRGGSLTLIHRADRLAALLAALGGRAGGIVVFPLWPRAGRAANRIVVQARKGSAAPLRLSAGLVLHGDGHRYGEAAEAVLRDGAPLSL